MSDRIKIARNNKANVGSEDFLTQLKIVGDEARNIDHLDHIPSVAKSHIITTIGSDGSINSEIELG